jgi:hypothetical protein
MSGTRLNATDWSNMDRAPKRKFKERSDDPRNWAATREQIGRQLTTFYERCMTDELPPRLLAAIKRLDEEQP